MPSHNHDLAFLCSAGNDMEAVIIMSLLESHNIPSIKKHEGIGDIISVYMGTSYQGINIFVLPELLPAAKEILSSETDLNEEFSDTPISDEEFSKMKRERDDARHAIAIVALLLICSVFIFSILYSLVH